MTTATELAWEHFQKCGWKIHSNEKFAALALAYEIDTQDTTWIPEIWVQRRADWSPSNTRDQLRRPRLEGIVITKEAEGKDGKTRTYYSLAGIGDK